MKTNCFTTKSGDTHSQFIKNSVNPLKLEVTVGTTLFNNKGLLFPTEGTSILTTDNKHFPPKYSTICPFDGSTLYPV